MALQNSEHTMESALPEIMSTKLSIIRILATWFVMTGHGFVFFQISVFKNQDYFCYIQNIGVVLLLLLAGFFLAYSLHRKMSTGYRFRDYWVDRICRLKIPLVSASIIIIAVDYISRKNYPNVQPMNDSSFATLIGNYLMLQLYPAFGLRVPCFGSAAQLWTLSVEWWVFMAAGCYYLIVKSKRAENIMYANGLAGNDKKRSAGFKLILSIIMLSIIICSLFEYSRMGIVPNAPFTMLLGMSIFYVVPTLEGCNTTALKLLSFGSMVFAVLCGIVVKDAYDSRFVIATALTILFILPTAEKTVCKPDDSISMVFKRLISVLSGYAYSLYLVHYSIFDLFHRKWITDGFTSGGGCLYIASLCRMCWHFYII